MWRCRLGVPRGSLSHFVTCTHATLLHPTRRLTRRSVEAQLPDNIRIEPPKSNDAATTRDELSSGVNRLYGHRAESAMRGMLGPNGQVEATESRALPLLGHATAEATRYTMERSTIFENWSHVCVPPVNWHLSKLGCATCKMAKDPHEAVEAIQLQVIKGCNVFELDGAASEVHQDISRALFEVMQAFELNRAGFVMVVRCGILRQPAFQEEITGVEIMNTAAARDRIAPIFERLKASSLPAMQLKTGFRISELSDEQLARLKLRRVSKNAAAGLTPDWLEAFLTNVAHNTKLECIDVLLLEGLHTLFDDRPEAHIDEDILQLFAFLEKQVELGVLQYYGVSSPHLAPPITRHYPPLPDDAELPDEFAHPPPPPPTLNLYRLVRLAERAGGKATHHMRFVQYPFNLTAHQALNTPLPYNGLHTLVTLCKELGLTTLGYSPLETTNLMNEPERYHDFPLETDLKAARMNFFQVMQRCTMKELDAKDTLLALKDNSRMPPLRDLLLASHYCYLQRRMVNLFYFSDEVEQVLVPRFRRALVRCKEASSPEMKQWCSEYEMLVTDMLRIRRRLFEHRHGKAAREKNAAIDAASPTLARCPMLNQKAINFATHGCDALLCGFHISRYFHEATELNPAQDGQLPVPARELAALCDSAAVSYADASPPHPYMLEPAFGSQGKLSKQKLKASAMLIDIDPQNPKFPDIPEEIDESSSTSSDSANDAKATAAAGQAPM